MSNVARLLLDTTHGAFPVVSGNPSCSGALEGTVNRPELLLALMQVPQPSERGEGMEEAPIRPKITFVQITEFIDTRKTKENSIDIR